MATNISRNMPDQNISIKHRNTIVCQPSLVIASNTPQYLLHWVPQIWCCWWLNSDLFCGSLHL